MAIEVKIIGTDPPCPRCAILGCLVSEVASEANLSVCIKHMSYEAEEAIRVGKQLNLVPGTAKHVQSAANLTVDWLAVCSIIDNPPSRQHLCRNPKGIASQWSQELDDILRPCQEAALAAGILMTPILVISTQIKHWGSVPPREQITNWLFQLAENDNSAISAEEAATNF